jgi:SPP1 family predicted phage head-tail adaptor
MSAPAPQAGSLNRRITLQQGIPGSTSEGDATQTWTPLGDLWASVNPMSTQELLLAAQRSEEVTHIVTIRWRAQFPAPENLRILYGQRLFFVVGTQDPDEGHRTLQMRCKELVTGAAVGAV